MGGCETERRNEVGKLRPVNKTITRRSAPKKPRTLVLLASPSTPEQRETNRCFLGALRRVQAQGLGIVPLPIDRFRPASFAK